MEEEFGRHSWSTGEALKTGTARFMDPREQSRLQVSANHTAMNDDQGVTEAGQRFFLSSSQLTLAFHRGQIPMVYYPNFIKPLPLRTIR